MRPAVGLQECTWPGARVGKGASANLFMNEITFRQDQTVESLLLFVQNRLSQGFEFGGAGQFVDNYGTHVLSNSGL